MVVIVFIRKLLDHVFTKKELQVLDDMLPDFHRKDRLDDEEALKVKVEKSFELVTLCLVLRKNQSKFSKKNNNICFVYFLEFSN